MADPLISHYFSSPLKPGGAWAEYLAALDRPVEPRRYPFEIEIRGRNWEDDMNWAVLAEALIQLLMHAPEYYQEVEDFWNKLHSTQKAAAAQTDAVREAVADAKKRARPKP